MGADRARIWSRPIRLNVSGGFYVHLLRVRRSGVLQRHRHSGQVHAYVMKGSWYYLEHDWVAHENSYVFEPPGETHTLVVPDECTEMVTMFTVSGALKYVDPQATASATTTCSPDRQVPGPFREGRARPDHVKTFIR